MADNLFDDVDDILAQDGASDTPDGQDEDKSFNEAELQDIMSEIEDLEKEFSNEEPKLVKSKLTPDAIQNELAELNEEDFEDLDVTEAVEEMESKMSSPKNEVEVPVTKATPSEKSSVLPFEKTTTAYKPAKNPEVSFEAQGQMTMSLDFKVGADSAKLTIDPIKGLNVVVAGVEISIDDVSGCTVMMENGMTFTIPLSTSAKSLKKKSA